MLHLLEPSTDYRAHAIDGRRGTTHRLGHAALDDSDHPDPQAVLPDGLNPGAQHQDLHSVLFGGTHTLEHPSFAVTGPLSARSALNSPIHVVCGRGADAAPPARRASAERCDALAGRRPVAPWTKVERLAQLLSLERLVSHHQWQGTAHSLPQPRRGICLDLLFGRPTTVSRRHIPCHIPKWHAWPGRLVSLVPSAQTLAAAATASSPSRAWRLAWNGCRTGTGQRQPRTVVCAGLKLGRDRVDIPSDSSFA